MLAKLSQNEGNTTLVKRMAAYVDRSMRDISNEEITSLLSVKALQLIQNHRQSYTGGKQNGLPSDFGGKKDFWVFKGEFDTQREELERAQESHNKASTTSS